jgi:zinc protease
MNAPRRTLSVLCLVMLSCQRVPPAAPGKGEPLPEIARDLNAPLPVDPRVKFGTLDNGLTWYIERNTRPEERVELRLVVKAGSILEDPDQLGLAHFVEHMAFNGSENFEGNELVRYLESIGTEFGAHLNAYTSFDETVYMLRIPTDDEAMLDKGLLVLRDWAGGLTFDPAECERERGVVLEEWRLGQGLGQRVQDATMPQVFFGSLYAERLPIGTETSLSTFECDAARRFYDDWYRPELMAVMAVGDVDVQVFEARIRERFGDLAGPETPRPRAYTRVPDHAEPLIKVFTDRELTGASVQVLDKVDDIEGSTHADYRDFLVEAVAWTILNERLSHLAQAPDAPLLGAGGQVSEVAHQRAAHVVGIAPKEGRELAALEAVLVELERLRRHGVTTPELQRAVDEQGRGFQAYYDERDKTDSATHVEELLRVFLTGEPMPGIPYEYALAASYLPELRTGEVSAFAKTLFTGESRVVQLLMPEKEGVSAPSEAEIRALLADVAVRPIDPPATEEALAPLMTELPTPGKVVEETADTALGIVTWKLSNGATVVLRPSDFQEDEVVFEAYSPGGHSLVSDADFVPAITASSVALDSGLGDHDAISLRKLLSGHAAQVSPYIGERFEGMSGGGSAFDVEILLQLIHLSFTRPRFDQDAFERDKAGRAEALRNRASSPDARFWDAWTKILWQDHLRNMPWSLEDLEQLDLERSRAIYQERFGDAGDFTFVFGGSLDAARFKPLVERYLASLPATGRVEAGRDTGARQVPGVHTQTLSFGDTPRGRVQLRLHGDFESNWTTRNHLSALEAVLSVRLREALREDLGGTYGVSVGVSSTEVPVSTYAVDVGFQCDPERIEELTAAMWKTLEELRATPVSEELIASVREKRRRERETAVRSNGFWVGSLGSTWRRGEDPHELLTFDARNASLTAADVQRIAALVLDPANHLLMIQRPEAQ